MAYPASALATANVPTRGLEVDTREGMVDRALTDFNQFLYGLKG